MIESNSLSPVQLFHYTPSDAVADQKIIEELIMAFSEDNSSIIENIRIFKETAIRFAEEKKSIPLFDLLEKIAYVKNVEIVLSFSELILLFSALKEGGSEDFKNIFRPYTVKTEITNTIVMAPTFPREVQDLLMSAIDDSSFLGHHFHLEYCFRDLLNVIKPHLREQFLDCLENENSRDDWYVFLRQCVLSWDSADWLIDSSSLNSAGFNDTLHSMVAFDHVFSRVVLADFFSPFFELSDEKIESIYKVIKDVVIDSIKKCFILSYYEKCLPQEVYMQKIIRLVEGISSKNPVLIPCTIEGKNLLISFRGTDDEGMLSSTIYGARSQPVEVLTLKKFLSTNWEEFYEDISCEDIKTKFSDIFYDGTAGTPFIKVPMAGSYEIRSLFFFMHHTIQKECAFTTADCFSACYSLERIFFAICSTVAQVARNPSILIATEPRSVETREEISIDADDFFEKIHTYISKEAFTELYRYMQAFGSSITWDIGDLSYIFSLLAKKRFYSTEDALILYRKFKKVEVDSKKTSQFKTEIQQEFACDQSNIFLQIAHVFSSNGDDVGDILQEKRIFIELLKFFIEHNIKEYRDTLITHGTHLYLDALERFYLLSLVENEHTFDRTLLDMVCDFYDTIYLDDDIEQIKARYDQKITQNMSIKGIVSYEKMYGIKEDVLYLYSDKCTRSDVCNPGSNLIEKLFTNISLDKHDFPKRGSYEGGAIHWPAHTILDIISTSIDEFNPSCIERSVIENTKLFLKKVFSPLLQQLIRFNCLTRMPDFDAQELVKKIKTMKIGEQVLYPFLNLGHALLVLFKKTSPSTLQINLYNTGSGLFRYHEHRAKSDQYQTFFIIDDVPIENGINQKVLEAVTTSIQESNETTYLYDVFLEILGRNGKIRRVTFEKEKYQTEQRFGSCVYQVILACMRHMLYEASLSSKEELPLLYSAVKEHIFQRMVKKFSEKSTNHDINRQILLKQKKLRHMRDVLQPIAHDEEKFIQAMKEYARYKGHLAANPLESSNKMYPTSALRYIKLNRSIRSLVSLMARDTVLLPPENMYTSDFANHAIVRYVYKQSKKHPSEQSQEQKYKIDLDIFSRMVMPVKKVIISRLDQGESILF